MKELKSKGESAKCRPAWRPSFLLICLPVWFAACSGTGTEAQRNSSGLVSTPIQPSASPRQNESPRPSFIRRVDFGNFTFPSLPTNKCSMEQVRLIKGTYDAPKLRAQRSEEDCWSVVLVSVDYGDVTDDGVEEAMVVLYAEAGGNESRQDVFVYASEGSDPKLLWKFATGDGADGGLKRVFADNGKLVIELYGLGAKIGKDVYGMNPPEVGTCCPKHFTRTIYKWVAGSFQEYGESAVSPNPSGSAATEMPRYQPLKHK
jgi:hypothetical protein